MSSVFIIILAPLAGFAQGGQRPPVEINFDQLSGQTNPQVFLGIFRLTVGSATFLFRDGGILRNQGTFPVDPTNVLFLWGATPSRPVSEETDNNCGGLEIDFSQRVSHFSASLMAGSDGPLTYTICDDQGGNQQVTLAENTSTTIYAPNNNIRQVTISHYGSCCLWFSAIDNVKFTPIDPVFLDPVDSGFVTSGPQVINNPQIMASGGAVVKNIAADGVTQAVVRIPANRAR